MEFNTPNSFKITDELLEKYNHIIDLLCDYICKNLRIKTSDIGKEINVDLLPIANVGGLLVTHYNVDEMLKLRPTLIEFVKEQKEKGDAIINEYNKVIKSTPKDKKQALGVSYNQKLEQLANQHNERVTKYKFDNANPTTVEEQKTFTSKIKDLQQLVEKLRSHSMVEAMKDFKVEKK
jgi:lysophospholipase L1-like esterase